MRDPLDAAVSALATRTEREPVDAGETRSRLMRSIARRERGQRARWATGVVGALLLTNSVTWAWSTERLPQAASELASMLRGEPEVVGSSGPRIALVDRATRASRVEVHAPAPRSASRVAEVTAQPAPAPRTEAPRRAPRGADARAAVSTEDVSPSVDPTESELDTRDRERFAGAHALHYEGTDPRLALSAWDRYLAEFPAGRFVPEAQWNRALCLVRLHDRERAIAALAPFAEGAHAGVRQREARAVLEVLERR